MEEEAARRDAVALHDPPGDLGFSLPAEVGVGVAAERVAHDLVFDDLLHGSRGREARRVGCGDAVGASLEPRSAVVGVGKHTEQMRAHGFDLGGRGQLDRGGLRRGAVRAPDADFAGREWSCR